MSLLEQAKRKAEAAGDDALAAPVTKPAGPMPAALRYLPILGHAADAISTKIALNAGAYEANPLVRPIAGNLPVFLASKVLVGAAQSYVAGRLEAAGHPRAARILSWVGALPLALALSNLNVTRQQLSRR